MKATVSVNTLPFNRPDIVTDSAEEEYPDPPEVAPNRTWSVDVSVLNIADVSVAFGNELNNDDQATSCAFVGLDN